MKLKDVLNERFGLLVSLPDNLYQLAMAARVAGADAVKVHANVHHRASGRRFDSLPAESTRIREVRRAIGNLSLGLMPGTDEAHATVAEIEEVGLETGIDYLDMYLDHVPAGYKNLGDRFSLMWALGHHWREEELVQAKEKGATMIEASIVDPALYRQPLSAEDLESYRRICAITDLPVIVPTQKAVSPGDLANLKAVGVAGIMIGAVVTGDDIEGINRATSAFREAIGVLSK